VCLIIKDEAQWLPGCLASIQQIAGEIIVVDTGSKDESLTIAQQYGAKIFKFDWQDDFAAARNFSLEQATGNWILVLDADEKISSQDHNHIINLIRQPATSPTAYKLLTRNYTNRNNLVGWQANPGDYPKEESGCGWIPSIKVRLWSNHPQIRFSYPVHELVEPALERLDIEPLALPVVIHHYGKLDDAAARKKGEKYFQIGWQKLESMDNNARIPLRELAIQAGMLGKFAEAAVLWQRFLDLDPKNCEALLNLGTALFSTGKIKQALAAVKKAAHIHPGLKEIRFNQALYELHLGRAADADKRIQRLLKKYPAYPAARFLQAAAHACHKGDKSGRQTFRQLQDQSLDFTSEIIQIAGQELSSTLARAGRTKYAEIIKKATADRLI